MTFLFILDIDSRQCHGQLLAHILELNMNRIRGRLSSLRLSKANLGDLPARLRLLLKAYIPNLSRADLADASQLQQHLQSFEDCVRGYQDSRGSSGVISIDRACDVVRAAFVLTEDDFSLRGRLQGLGVAQAVFDSRDIKQVDKIANYWRICLTWTKIARSYRRYFRNINWKSVEPYQPSYCCPVEGKPQFVHAEIQLLVFYEKNPDIRKPRAIGASKEACFLCDSFLRAEGNFKVTKAHRQVYPQWTVPDLKDYSDHSVSKFRDCLRDTLQNLQNEAKVSRSSQAFPVQSSINFHPTSIPSPVSSISTFRPGVASVSDRFGTQVSCSSRTASPRLSSSRASFRGQKTADILLPASADTKSRVSPSWEAVKGSSDTSSTSTTSTIIERDGSTTVETLRVHHRRIDSGFEDAELFGGWAVVATPKTVQYSNWLTLEMSMMGAQALDSSHASIESGREYRTGSVQVDDKFNQRKERRLLNLDDLPYDKDLVLSRNALDGDSELTFELGAEGKQSVLVRCIWIA